MFGFLTSSSTTRLYRGWVPRLTSGKLTCCHTRDRTGRRWLLSQPVILYWHRPNQYGAVGHNGDRTQDLLTRSRAPPPPPPPICYVSPASTMGILLLKVRLYQCSQKAYLNFNYDAHYQICGGYLTTLYLINIEQLIIVARIAVLLTRQHLPVRGSSHTYLLQFRLDWFWVGHRTCSSWSFLRSLGHQLESGIRVVTCTCTVANL